MSLPPMFFPNKAALIPPQPSPDPSEGKLNNPLIIALVNQLLLEESLIVSDPSSQKLPPLVGTSLPDELVGMAGNDVIYGLEGDDVLRGDDTNAPIGGDDEIHGGSGNDLIGGKGGNDLLFGDAGDDQIWGDAGDDILRGGLGNDILTGDNAVTFLGHDTFVLAVGEGTDTITDFEVGIDLIGLADGLTLGALSFSGNAIIAGSEVLAVLDGVDTTTLTETAFVVV